MIRYLLFYFPTINYIRATLEPQKCSNFSQFLFKYANTRKHFLIFICRVNRESVTESTCTPRVSQEQTLSRESSQIVSGGRGEVAIRDSEERTRTGHLWEFASAGSHGAFWRYFVSTGAAHPEVTATGSERSFPGNRCTHCLLSKVG